jgi:hypothetical protein
MKGIAWISSGSVRLIVTSNTARYSSYKHLALRSSPSRSLQRTAVFLQGARPTLQAKDVRGTLHPVVMEGDSNLCPGGRDLLIEQFADCSQLPNFAERYILRSRPSTGSSAFQFERKPVHLHFLPQDCHRFFYPPLRHKAPRADQIGHHTTTKVSLDCVPKANALDKQRADLRSSHL